MSRNSDRQTSSPAGFAKPIGGSIVAACLALLGCTGADDKATVDLTGAVSVDGKPLPANAEGSITFMPQQAGQARPTSARIVDSRYEAKDVPVGAVSAAVSIQQKTGKIINLPGGSSYEEYKSILPQDSPGGERIEVTADMSEHNFDL